MSTTYIVDTLQRTGVAYHFAKEIQELLCGMQGDEQGFSDDLHITATRFYLLRKHAWVPRLSCNKYHDSA